MIIEQRLAEYADVDTFGTVVELVALDDMGIGLGILAEDTYPDRMRAAVSVVYQYVSEGKASISVARDGMWYASIDDDDVTVEQVLARIDASMPDAVADGRA